MADKARRDLEVCIQPQAPFLTTHTHTYIYLYSLTLESSKLKPEVFPPYPAISSDQDKTPCFRTQSQGFHGRLGHPMDRGQGRSYRADVGTDPHHLVSWKGSFRRLREVVGLDLRRERPHVPACSG